MSSHGADERFAVLLSGLVPRGRKSSAGANSCTRNAPADEPSYGPKKQELKRAERVASRTEKRKFLAQQMIKKIV